MKNFFTILLLLICITSFSQKNSIDGSIEKVKRQRLSEVQLMSEIIPNYPPEYKQMIDYVLIEIVTYSNGEKLVALSKNETLTDEQKSNLRKTDSETYVEINIKFTYKDPKNDDLGGNQKIKSMTQFVKVI